MNRLSLLIALVFVIGATEIVWGGISDPVRTESGSVSGTTGTSGEVRVFKGIPYAAPPVGPLRWKAPQPAAKWDGVRKADAFGARCMQGGFGGGRGGRGRGDAAAPPQGAQGAGREGGRRGQGDGAGQPVPAAQPPTSEDCLYINVWTSANSASDRRPVMVFSYGGGFTGGAGSEARYDGEALARKGAVVVTYNYRLGPFGWFAHPELTKESGRNASGNYGLMDAVAALKWVQKNIANFGGDPRRVTIFGESAGAFQVAAMVGSPEAKGLFQRGIAESGAWMGIRMGRMTTRTQAEELGLKMASALGASSIGDLRAKSADDIQRDLRGSGMIVDGWYVPEDPSITFAQGRQNDVDLLVGSNKDEGTFFGMPPGAAQWVTGARQRFGDLADTYLKLYPGSSDAEANASYLAAFSDEMHWHMRIWAELHAKKGKKAYLYYFTREPATAPDQPSRGATHTAELAYVFNVPLPGRPWEEVDKQLADAMTSYWVNFATSGDPNGKGLPNWPAIRDRSTSRAMILGDKVMVEPTPNAEKLNFFDAAYTRQKTTQTN